MEGTFAGGPTPEKTIGWLYGFAYGFGSGVVTMVIFGLWWNW